MSELLDQYQNLLGVEVISQLKQIARPLKGLKVVHVNSTKYGGGVAEILDKMIPLCNALDVHSQWEVINGAGDFFQCTKIMHNTIQGKKAFLSDNLKKAYEATNAFNAEELRSVLHDADIVFIHDPQPLPLINHFPDRKGKWVWRCHIDASHPYRPTWKYLSDFIIKYDASIFSLPDFVQPLPHPMFLIPPSIDPLGEKNMELPQEEIFRVYERFGIDPGRPMILQVSRFDYFKDPVGVIEAFKLAKKFKRDIQLVLAGGGAADDPESEMVLKEVKAAAEEQSDIHILFLPPDSHRTINALQRAAAIVMQKSVREGFGLTVTEALWKSKPVIGGSTGGIRLQVIDHHTGFQVHTPEGAALKIRYLLENPDMIEKMGRNGREFVKENFLITRHVREYLTLLVSMLCPDADRIELKESVPSSG